MNYIAEIPWWIPAALVLAGVILFITGNNRLERKLRNAGAGMALLGVLLAAISLVLESDREMASRQSRELVYAVPAQKWDVLRSLLDPNLTLMGLKGHEAIITGAQLAVERFDLRGARVISTDVQQIDAAQIEVEVQVLAEFKDGNSLSRWRLTWEKLPDGWQVASVAPLVGVPRDIEQDLQRPLK